MKKLISLIVLVVILLTTNLINSNDGTKLVAQTNHWAMPTPKWCPKALMYATECTASGMGCQIVKCKGSDT